MLRRSTLWPKRARSRALHLFRRCGYGVLAVTGMYYRPQHQLKIRAPCAEGTVNTRCDSAAVAFSPLWWYVFSSLREREVVLGLTSVLSFIFVLNLDLEDLFFCKNLLANRSGSNNTLCDSALSGCLFLSR